MLAKHDTGSDEQYDLKFLNNLREDLRILETSWRNKNLRRKRVVHHFIEIIDSIAEIARVESVEPARAICADLKEYLAMAANRKANLEERSWTTAAELIDLLSDSLGEETEPSSGLEELRISWKKQVGSRGRQAESAAASPGAEPGDAESPNLEEIKMTDSNGTDPQKLLAMAQEALLSGQGESAKEMALKAAELITQGAAEERKKKELNLTTDLENIASEQSEIDLSISHTNERISERETELHTLTESLSEAQSSLDKHEASCKQVRDDIDRTEAKMAALKEQHKEMLDRFQEALPARDAAERECAKIKAAYGELPADIESLRDALHELEHRAKQIRQKKDDTEAELEKLAQKAAV